MKFYSKSQVLLFIRQKIWLLKKIINTVRRTTTSKNPAIQLEYAAYRNISPRCLVTFWFI